MNQLNIMRRLILCFIACLIIFACSESDYLEDQNNPSEVNFYALAVGNSWVYKNYRYDHVTNLYTDSGVIDSIAIVAVQDFSGETYFKFRRLTTGNDNEIPLYGFNGEYFEFLREFEGNLMNEEGEIKFTNNNYEERLLREYSWGSVYETLVEGDEILSVEAGDFSCIKSERYFKDLDGIQLTGLDKFYYSSKYGLIYSTVSAVNNSTPLVIRRLDSYEIQ